MVQSLETLIEEYKCLKLRENPFLMQIPSQYDCNEIQLS